MTRVPDWTRHDTPEPPDRRRTRLGRGATPPPVRANTDALLCAWIVGLALAALLCLFLGDHLHALAYGGN